jgi:hypothetical protein
VAEIRHRPKDQKKMQVIKSADNNQDPRRQSANLDSRYGKIGISAVAAAVRYQGETETRAPADRRSYANDNA